MSKKVLRKLAYSLTLFIQIALAVSIFIIEYLTNKNAGIMQYVRYNKFVFEHGILNTNNLQVIKIISIILFIIFGTIFMHCIKNKKNTFIRYQITISMIMSIIVSMVISSNYFIGMLAYHYFIITFILVLLIQMLVVGITFYIDNKQKNRTL
ncbi:hypothetical protein PN290_11105 [Romboutsia sp. 1001216sp1]|uniref:hypothetical protein n=1 Tax=Romboutsia TaxID=1501226 RepID=UPI000B893244|nr:MULTISPECIES: hypothetical protein [Romboutsia]MDB8789569.1 hypothetical protein [Romboutsia sp. 1001216sp1]MDB8793825.1 hypothetical protein [Romboutsia sp. 1001216sp1]MDB8796716.1 hypothetical protein [Romboutsia sp. 1001216sp1]MDB8799921.1 hypothetical protein [Romboutsia sp. 1001216sp1]MDB8802712.1 hypothetical protein [Romboutsia sp. 1001216sp1]